MSAGSGLLASYAGEYGDDSGIEVGVAIGGEYNGPKRFTAPLPWFYENVMTSSLKSIFRENQEILSAKLDAKYCLESKSICEFDERVYCKLSNKANLVEYWKDNDPMRNIRNITSPFLVITSLDDPVCDKANIPYSLFKEHDKFMLALFSKGGHCGFHERGTLEKWSDKLAIDYILSILKFKNLL